MCDVTLDSTLCESASIGHSQLSSSAPCSTSLYKTAMTDTSRREGRGGGEGGGLLREKEDITHTELDCLDLTDITSCGESGVDGEIETYQSRQRARRTGGGGGGGGGVSVVTCSTTSSEVEFRRDLAALDADIARLQVHFRVALQPPQ